MEQKALKVQKVCGLDTGPGSNLYAIKRSLPDSFSSYSAQVLSWVHSRPTHSLPVAIQLLQSHPQKFQYIGALVVGHMGTSKGGVGAGEGGCKIYKS